MRIWDPRLGHSDLLEELVPVAGQRLLRRLLGPRRACRPIGVLPLVAEKSRGAVGGRVVRVTEADVTIDGLPPGLSARHPSAADAPDVAALLAAHQRRREGVGRGRPRGGARPARRHRLVDPPPGARARARPGGWSPGCRCTTGPSGRTLVEVTVTPHLPDGDAAALAAALFAAGRAARCRHRGGAPGAHLPARLRCLRRRRAQQQRWLAAAGYEQTRTWLQMTRPVTADEAWSLPALRPGVHGAPGRAARRRAARGPGPAGRAPGARGVLPGPLQLVPRELPRVRDAAA